MRARVDPARGKHITAKRACVLNIEGSQKCFHKIIRREATLIGRLLCPSIGCPSMSFRSSEHLCIRRPPCYEHNSQFVIDTPPPPSTQALTFTHQNIFTPDKTYLIVWPVQKCSHFFWCIVLSCVFGWIKTRKSRDKFVVDLYHTTQCLFGLQIRGRYRVAHNPWPINRYNLHD